MPDPVAVLTFAPTVPTPVTDGVTFTVTGPVAPRGRIVLLNGDLDQIGLASEEFSQHNVDALVSAGEAWGAEITGTPNGGTFKLAVFDQLHDVDYGASEALAYDITGADLTEALEDLVGTGNVTVTGDGPYVIVFGVALPVQEVSVTLDDNSLSGGTSPDVALTRLLGENVPTAVVAGGPFNWTPVLLPAGSDEAILLADLVATEDADDLSVYEGDSLLDAPVYIYS